MDNIVKETLKSLSRIVDVNHFQIEDAMHNIDDANTNIDCLIEDMMTAASKGKSSADELRRDMLKSMLAISNVRGMLSLAALTLEDTRAMDNNCMFDHMTCDCTTGEILLDEKQKNAAAMAQDPTPDTTDLYMVEWAIESSNGLNVYSRVGTLEACKAKYEEEVEDWKRMHFQVEEPAAHVTRVYDHEHRNCATIRLGKVLRADF